LNSTTRQIGNQRLARIQRTVAFPAKVKETIGAQIKTTAVECDLTEEDLAEVMETGYSISAASPRQRNGTSRVNP